MTVHVFRCTVGNDVGSPLKWAAVHGSCEGVVDNQWHAVGVGNVGKLLDVEHAAARIRYCFAEEQLGFLAEGLGNFLFGCFL